MKAIKLIVAVVSLMGMVASAQIGEPDTVVNSSSSSTWTNAIFPQTGASAFPGWTNTTRIDVPRDAYCMTLQFKGYLNAASTAATNVFVNLRRSLDPLANATTYAGAITTSKSHQTNAVNFGSWEVPIAAGAAQAFGATNIVFDLATTGYYPYWYVEYVRLGYTDAAYMTNYTLKVSFGRR